MFNVFANISWLSVIIAFVLYFLLGAMWYLFLFPKPYRISLGRDPEIQQDQAPIFIVGPAVCALIITIINAILMYALNINSYGDTLIFTAIVGFGYLFTNTVNIAINPNIPRPFLYGLITGSYHLVGTFMVNTILILMK